MNAKQITQEISKLSIRYGASDAADEKFNSQVEQLAEKAAENLTAKGLKITKGSSSPSSTRTYERIYLEPIGNFEHNSRVKACGVLETWEWQTNSRHGFTPVPRRDILSVLKQLAAYNG